MIYAKYYKNSVLSTFIVFSKSVYTIKIITLYIFALKCTFLGQKRVKHTRLVRQSINIIFIVLGIYNFVIDQNRDGTMQITESFL